MGFKGTSSSDWSASSIKADPAKTRVLATLTQWAERYQDAVAAQMDYRKPADTFAAVPTLGSLKAAP